jgi:hypothetical protein
MGLTQTFNTGRTAVSEWKDDTHITEWLKKVKERAKQQTATTKRAAIKVRLSRVL